MLEFQGDMISESTREGVAAAEAAGRTLGRPGELDDALAPQVDVVLDVPGRLADLLRIAGDEVVRLALVSGRSIRRGPGYSVRMELHRAVLEQSAAAAGSAGPAERKAHRVFAGRVAAVEATRLHGLSCPDTPTLPGRIDRKLSTGVVGSGPRRS
ncbi:hypothetical protein [Nonomuraea sp. NPDC005650]|uniref:hypothetical protein n=1 Tax=Nonomuraea sp. NPDC005650 TaxID=3157045 RepID=UPI0033AAFFF7